MGKIHCKSGFQQRCIYSDITLHAPEISRWHPGTGPDYRVINQRSNVWSAISETSPSPFVCTPRLFNPNYSWIFVARSWNDRQIGLTQWDTPQEYLSYFYGYHPDCRPLGPAPRDGLRPSLACGLRMCRSRAAGNGGQFSAAAEKFSTPCPLSAGSPVLKALFVTVLAA